MVPTQLSNRSILCICRLAHCRSDKIRRKWIAQCLSAFMNLILPHLLFWMQQTYFARYHLPCLLNHYAVHHINHKQQWKVCWPTARNGAFVFISQLLTGTISNRELFLQNGMMDLLKSILPHQSLMVHHGFEVQYLILKNILPLNINGSPFKVASKQAYQWQMSKRHKQLHARGGGGERKCTCHISTSFAVSSLNFFVKRR